MPLGSKLYGSSWMFQRVILILVLVVVVCAGKNQDAMQCGRANNGGWNVSTDPALLCGWGWRSCWVETWRQASKTMMMKMTSGAALFVAPAHRTLSMSITCHGLCDGSLQATSVQSCDSNHKSAAPFRPSTTRLLAVPILVKQCKGSGGGGDILFQFFRQIAWAGARYLLFTLFIRGKQHSTKISLEPLSALPLFLCAALVYDSPAWQYFYDKT